MSDMTLQGRAVACGGRRRSAHRGARDARAASLWRSALARIDIGPRVRFREKRRDSSDSYTRIPCNRRSATVSARDTLVCMRGHHCVLAVFALAGCNQILGIGDIKSGGAADASADGRNVDAMTIDANPFLCPPAAANEVIGCAVVTHVDANGNKTQTQKDLSTFLVSAYVVDATQASGFKIVNGTTGVGILHIEGVPDGASFYLRLQDPTATNAWPHYFFTDKHDLDLGYVEAGRDSTPATLDTEVTFDLSAMTAWTKDQDWTGGDNDDITVQSFNSGTGYDVTPMGNTVAEGVTSVKLTADWRNGGGEQTWNDFIAAGFRLAQLVDPSAGDDLWAVHTVTKTVGDTVMRPVVVKTIADAVQFTPTKMTDGAPITYTGAFTHPTPNGSPQVISLNAATVRAAFNDENRFFDETWSCTILTGPAAAEGLTYGPSLLAVTGDQVITDATPNVSATYADPFPTAWPQLMSCFEQHLRHFKVPGTNRGSTGPSYLSSVAPASANFVWTPQIHSVANLKIGGSDPTKRIDAIAGGAAPFDGTAPVVMTWDPIPGVTHYQVRVKDETLNSFPAQFDTSQNAASMPADVFVKGHFYAMRVFAIQTSGDYAGGHLLQYKTPLWQARITTGLVRLSSDCGNGVVDAGEDCDPGTPNTSTATCDADCSAVQCGDGFWNLAAGEKCDDSGTASAFCNGDCTLTKCGDGQQNFQAGEECDDGNVVNGDGCSATCKLEKCGDGVLIAGVEGCDDGNRVSGDGCDAFCQPENSWNCDTTVMPTKCTRQ
jgi:cysteine-rich repeat protein